MQIVMGTNPDGSPKPLPVWEMPPEYYDSFYEFEPSYSGAPSESQYFGVWKRIAEKVEPDERIIDFGCGSGQLISILNDSGMNVVAGIDFSPKGLEIAKRLNPGVPFIYRNLYNPSAYEFVYDTAILSEVLEHLEKDYVVFGFLHPGTHVIFTLPDFYTPAHLRAFTSKKEIEERYGKSLAIKSIEKVELKPGMNIYITDGVTNG